MASPSTARDYISDELSIEAEEHPESEESFDGLVSFVDTLQSDDKICVRLAICIEPFLEDDDRLDGTHYRAGVGFEYLEETDPSGDYREYLEGLVEALQIDHRRWLAHLAEAGNNAEWRIESGPPQLHYSSES
jgi:hypothetical protein